MPRPPIPLEKRPAPDELRRLFSYDPASGDVRWRIMYRSKRPGDLAGYVWKGYRRITIRKITYPAGAIIWAMQTGAWPTHQIDHRDTNGSKSNEWANLREATPLQNGANRKPNANNKSGHPGVRRTPKGRWRSEIKSGQITRNLGTYDLFEDAVAARQTAEIKYFGEFAPRHAT